MRVGDLEITLAWRSGSPRPYLTVAGRHVPVALTTEVTRGDLIQLSRWMEERATRGLRDDYTNTPRLIPEETK